MVFGECFGECFEKMTERKRKLNYSLREKEIIVRAITRFGRLLHGPESLNTTPARRRQILQDITDDVNALGVRPGPSVDPKKDQ